MQREPPSLSFPGRDYLLPNRHSSLPLLSQPSNYYLDSQFESMSPYRYSRQLNGIYQSSPITSSASLSPYSAGLQTRTGDTVIDHHLDLASHRNLRHPTEQNGLSNQYSGVNLSHTLEMNSTDAGYFRPSALNSNNPHNVTDISNDSDYLNELKNELSPEFRNSLSYPHQRLISSHHNMVRRHRSLPPGSFQREFDLYPGAKYSLSDQVQQRSASLKFPVSFRRRSPKTRISNSNSFSGRT